MYLLEATFQFASKSFSTIKTLILNFCYILSKKKLIPQDFLSFQVAAGGLIFLGSWVFKTYHHYNELTTANFTLVPASIVIAVGVILFIVGGLGCTAACKENKCLLAVVSTIIFLKTLKTLNFKGFELCAFAR